MAAFTLIRSFKLLLTNLIPMFQSNVNQSIDLQCNFDVPALLVLNE